MGVSMVAMLSHSMLAADDANAHARSEVSVTASAVPSVDLNPVSPKMPMCLLLGAMPWRQPAR
jgi:hypothetical protein